MTIRRYAQVTGFLYVFVGLISLAPTASIRPVGLPHLHLDVSYGLFLGLFAQNIVNKIALIGFGVGGLLAWNARRDDAAVLYARAVFFIMGLAAVLGMVHETRTFFGYWPLWGNEAALHAVNAAIGGYFGFIHHESHTRHGHGIFAH